MPNYTLSFTASSTLVRGIGAHVNVLVDGKKIGSTFVGSTAKTYTFKTPLVTGIGHDVRLVYTNDTVANGQDRNLNVRSIAVNGHPVLATSAHEIYHAAGQGNLHSTGAMKWNGNAEFRLPASMFTSTSPTPGQVAPARGYYVSTTGNDSGNGSAAHPFKTLDRAVSAMESSNIHKTYVEGGTYNLSSTLNLDGADSGMTITAARGAHPILDGNHSLQTLVSLNGANHVTLKGLDFTGANGQALILDGASSNRIVGNGFAGNGEGMLLRNGASKNVVSGNVVNHSSTSGIEFQDGSDGNRIISNVVNGTGAVETNGAGIYGHGVDNNMIAHNLVKNTAGMGIGIQNWDSSTISIGNKILHNVVRNANTSPQTQDSGSIYLLGRNNLNMHTVISGNYISGPTTAAGGSGAHIVGIYLDDNSSGVTVTNNIVTHIISHGLQIHGGNDILVKNNIFDLGSTGQSAVLFQNRASDVGGATMQNDVVTNNIIVSKSGSPTAFDNIDGGNPTISNNFYMDLINNQFQTNGLSQSGAHYGNAMFTNEAAGNFALRANSGAHAIGFLSIREHTMGPHPTTAHWYKTSHGHLA
jgi:parallel beta-helix repeat protein